MDRRGDETRLALGSCRENEIISLGISVVSLLVFEISERHGHQQEWWSVVVGTVGDAIDSALALLVRY